MNFFVFGLAISCINVAKRSHTLSVISQRLSRTCNVCKKTSLWAYPCSPTCMSSIPESLSSSGKTYVNKPVSCNIFKPILGFLAFSKLINSSLIRSCEIMEILSAINDMAFFVSGSISHSSLAENLAARIMRSGSSLNVIIGSSGVRSILFARSV